MRRSASSEHDPGRDLVLRGRDYHASRPRCASHHLMEFQARFNSRGDNPTAAAFNRHVERRLAIAAPASRPTPSMRVQRSNSSPL